MALDALIFDVDGSLIDSNPLHVMAFALAFAERGYKVAEDRIEIEMGKGGDQLVPAILGPSADKADGDAIRARQPELFAVLAGEKKLKPFDRAAELMTAARRSGLLVVIATSSGKKSIETLERESGWKFTESADLVVNADDAKHSKPAPDLIAAAVAKAKLSPGQVGMIGDTIYDVRSARRAGVTTAGLLCGGNSADHLFEAGARAVFKDAGDLLDHLDDALAALSPGPTHHTASMLERLMEEALSAAEAGFAAGEVPIGAVVARGDCTVIGRGFNRLNATGNRTAHAEIVAFADAAGKYPADAGGLILVSTLEPCVMCTGAAMEAAVDAVVFGLAAPADAGSGRVTPPKSPDTRMPRIVGNVLGDRSLGLLEAWHRGNTAGPQAKYVGQLLQFHRDR